MLNVSAIPLDEISPIWDDGFLLLSKSLLSAVTLDDFIHKLNKIDASFGGVTRVNLILNMGADEEAIFYFMGHSGPKHLVCPKAELHLSPVLPKRPRNRPSFSLPPALRIATRRWIAKGSTGGCAPTASSPLPPPAAIWVGSSLSTPSSTASPWRPSPS